MTESGTFARLVGLAQAGDEQAAQRLHDEYAHHILRAVRRRLHPTMRPQFDSLDFAQDVWASFFVTPGPDYAVQTPEQLVALLTAMARNKVAEKSRDRMMRSKRNVNRERGLDEGVANNVLVDRTTPSQVAMGEEAWNKLLALQPPVYRRVLMLLRDGKTPAAIASEMKISSKTVQRVLRLARS
jgi:DNA-directed RNA polymerase specialized sigma24 family protein